MFDHKINETVIFNRYWIGRFSDRREDSNPTTFQPCVLFDGFSLSSVQNYPRLPKKNFFKLIFQLNRNSIKSDEKKVVNRNKIRGKWSFWRLEFFFVQNERKKEIQRIRFSLKLKLRRKKVLRQPKLAVAVAEAAVWRTTCDPATRVRFRLESKSRTIDKRLGLSTIPNLTMLY